MDSRASNLIKNHKEWFTLLEKPEKARVVETRYDIPHPIEHIGDVLLIHVGQKGIMNNLVRKMVGQIVDQGI